MFLCAENRQVQVLCDELRSIRKGMSERMGTGELCSIIIIVVSRP